MVRRSALHYTPVQQVASRHSEAFLDPRRTRCDKPSLMSLKHREQLNQHGWARIDEAFTEDDMLSVARDLGAPTPSPTGELIKILAPMSTVDARRQTLSSRYGKGSQPLHTDTAFWTMPVRYLVLSVRGDKRRPTELLNFSNVISSLGTSEPLVNRSVWRAGPGVQSFYCSMRFQHNGMQGWRFDPIVMTPANAAARMLLPALEHILKNHDQRIVFSWNDIGCLIIDNWRVLHARGMSPVDENHRELLRIYVR